MGNRKNRTPKLKEPITIRFKKLASGKHSIYLDIYNNGNREYEFLKLYIIPEKTEADKEANKQTMKLANTKKSKRFIEMQEKGYGFRNLNKSKAQIIPYIQKVADEMQKEKGSKQGRHQTYRVLISHITKYSGIETTFRQITEEYYRGFIGYLKAAKNAHYKSINESPKLSTNTLYSYVDALRAIMNKAVKSKIVQNNPISLLDNNEIPKLKKDNREYLTIAELEQLVNAPCIRPTIKNAFLFSCLSGLRFSDVRALTWDKIQKDNDGKTIIRFTQKKTGENENLQISDKALKYLPKKNEVANNDLVFSLPCNAHTNETLKSWIYSAGIEKRVTFHVARHTNATLLLSLGAPIETVSKLLGHADIQTTQIYAKVIDSNKREAVSKLDSLTGI